MAAVRQKRPWALPGFLVSHVAPPRYRSLCCAKVQSQCRCRRSWNLSHLFPGRRSWRREYLEEHFWGCNNKSKICLCILCHMLIGFNGSFSPLFAKHLAMLPGLDALCHQTLGVCVDLNGHRSCSHFFHLRCLERVEGGVHVTHPQTHTHTHTHAYGDTFFTCGTSICFIFVFFLCVC